MPKKANNVDFNTLLQLYVGGHLGSLTTEYSSVVAMLVTPTDELWVGLATDLWYYAHGQWRRSPSPFDNIVIAFAWYQNLLWAFGRGVAVLRNGQWEPAPTPPFDFASSAIVDQQNRLWVGTDTDGLWRTADGKAWQHVELPSNGSCIGALYCATDGALWIAEVDDHPVHSVLYRCYNDHWYTLPFPAKRGGFRYIRSLVVDRDNTLWAGSDGQGIWRWDGAAWTHISAVRSERPGLANNWVQALASDAAGRVWIGSVGGLQHLTETAWHYAYAATDEDVRAGVMPLWPYDEIVSCFHLDAKGRLWVGTADGQVGWLDTTSPLQFQDVSYELSDPAKPTWVAIANRQ